MVVAHPPKLGAEIHGVTLTPVAAQFTAANSESLTIADNAALSFGSNVDMTIAGWVYFDSLADFETLFAKDDVAGSSMEYRLIIGAPGNPVFQVSPDGTAGAAVSAGWTEALVVDTWYFIVCQYDQAEITIRVNQESPVATAHTGDIFDGNDAFAFGADGEGDFFYLDGRLDAWGIWKRVLTEAELSYLYNGGHARMYADLDSSMKTSMVAWWGFGETSGNRADSHGSNTLTDNNTVTSAEGVDVISMLGYLPIDSASDTDAINEVGSAILTCRATPTNEALATVGREVRLFADGEGEIFRGFINGRDWGVGPSEQRSISLQCLTLDGRELGRRSTFRGVAVENTTVQSAIDSVLSGTGWSGLVSGSGYETDITKRWDNASRLRAALELAKIAGAYTRRTTTARQLEIKNEFADSGIILANVAHLGPEIGPSNPTYGAVSGIRRLKEDGNRIVNRIAPFAKTDGDNFIDLRNSDRSSPYTIKSFIPKVATPVNYTRTQGSAGNAAEDWLRVQIECWGNNRALVLFAFEEADVSAAAMDAYVDGIGADTIGATVTVDNDRIRGWTFTNPQVGLVDVAFRTASAGRDLDVYVIACQDVDIVDPVRTEATNSGTGTSASVAVTSELTDLLLDFLGFDNQAITPTATAGQTILESGATAGEPTADTTVGFRTGAATSTSMTYTLSGSETWGMISVALKSAPVYYIEDATSIESYALSEIAAAFGDYSRAITVGNDVEMANTIYDRAVDELLKRKDPPTSYEIDVLFLPDSVTWLPGDTMAVDFYDAESGMEVDEDLIVVKRTRTYDDTGAKRWGLTLSTVAEMQDEISDLVRLAERVNQVQSVQV